MQPASSRKQLLVVVIVLFVVGIAIQFVRPPLENPPVTADLQVPPSVKFILGRACYNCHSNETHLAWFDEPAPAYWLVVKDISDGRRALNFSSWDSLSKAQQAAKLFESIFQIEQHAMPLGSYAFLHQDAAVSADDLGVLKQYALSLAYVARPDTARERAAREQYEQCMAGSVPTGARDEYNGISYRELAGWPEWQVVSTTERYDNGTLRVILGNDVTVRAIREGHTHPYPDGAIFAKAAWDQVLDTSGEIRAGAFRQVEFMVRDSRKYDSSFGWGWARWVGGLALKPYGKDASFVSECMNCHRPLDKTDHTFTFPVQDTLRGRFIGSWVDPRKRTMSTLYRNGGKVTVVTWSQREDPHWFGGRIPDKVKLVEVLPAQYIAVKKPSVVPHP